MVIRLDQTIGEEIRKMIEDCELKVDHSLGEEEKRETLLHEGVVSIDLGQKVGENIISKLENIYQKENPGYVIKRGPGNMSVSSNETRYSVLTFIDKTMREPQET